MTFKDKPFTREMLLTMSSVEIHQFWIDRQRSRRDAGEDFQSSVVDVITGEATATIDGGVNEDYFK